MKLIYLNKKNEEMLISEPSNIEEIHKDIKKFLDEHNFKSYYTRVMPDGDKPNRIILDFGSWSEFIAVEGITFEEYVKQIKEKGER